MLRESLLLLLWFARARGALDSQVCPARLGTVGQGNVPYACARNINGTLSALKACSAKRGHPASDLMAQGAVDFAEHLSAFVRRVLGVTEEDFPLRFAYYTNYFTDTVSDCLRASAGPYQVGGGGEALCKLINAHAGLLSKRLGNFFTMWLEVESPGDWNKTADVALDFGYTSHSQFLDTVAPNKLYHPDGMNLTLEELVVEQSENGLPYWGLSGGGGAGAGFEIYCVNDKTGKAEALLSGGGGGGGGISSPEEGTPLQAGGGGGGGVQTGSFDALLVGAGAGNHPAGQVFITTNATHSAWTFAIRRLKGLMVTCASSEGMHIELRGGGGGGAGFEVFGPWNVTDPDGSPEVIGPQPLSFGYGFQFAMGSKDSVLLDPNAGEGEAAFLACPEIAAAENDSRKQDLCQDCVGRVPGHQKGSVMTNGTKFAVSEIYFCADTWAQLVCSRAKTSEPTPRAYGKFSNFMSCNCPVSRMFKRAYLPDSPQFQFERNISSCLHDAVSDTLPLITPEVLMKHRDDWCKPTPKLQETDCRVCKPLPECMPAEPNREEEITA